MTDWIEHTTDTCPVDPETVVEVRVKHGASIVDWSPPRPARRFRWPDPCITHYRIITPAPTPPLFLGGDPVKPPEPEMTKTHDDYTGPTFGVPTKPEPDLITLRLECLKIAVHIAQKLDVTEMVVADRLLHYVLNGSVDKA
jgi:hypothetical protein